MGGLAKNHCWLVATQKKRIGEQLNYIWNMCPKRFCDGKSGGPLLARVAIKSSLSTFILCFSLHSLSMIPLLHDKGSLAVPPGHRDL